MAFGRGKYDKICEDALKETKALGLLLLVIEGENGSGFSVKATFEIMLGLPELLEAAAELIRKDLQAGNRN